MDSSNKKIKKISRFSAIITGASLGGSPELMDSLILQNTQACLLRWEYESQEQFQRQKAAVSEYIWCHMSWVHGCHMSWVHVCHMSWVRGCHLSWVQAVAAQGGSVSIIPVWKQAFAAAAQWHYCAWLLHWMVASPESPFLQ